MLKFCTLIAACLTFAPFAVAAIYQASQVVS
jgi:hypothetical protein